MSDIQGRKHCKKMRNCLLQAISPFLTMFSTAIYLQCFKMRYCVVMGKNVLCLILQIFLYLEVFECNTTSEWLNRMVKPTRSYFTFQFGNLGEKDKECF